MSAAASSPRPTDPAPSGPGAPASVKVAVGVLAGLALLLLLNAVFTLLARDAVVDALVDADADLSRSDAEQTVLVNLVQAVVFGLLAAVSAWGVSRRRRWGRWAGIAATVLLGLVTLGATLLTGGIAVSSMLLLVLCAAAATSLFARTTAAWTGSGRSS